MEPGFELEVESTRARTKPLHGRPGVKSFLLAIPSDTVYTITKPCDSVHPCRDFVTRHTSTSPTIVKFTNRVEKSLAVAPFGQNLLPGASTVHHVVDSSGVLNTKRPSHDFRRYHRRPPIAQKI